MTLNMGVRFERFVAQIKNQNVGAGPVRAGAHVHRSDRACRAGSTSRRGSASPTTCSATPGPRSRRPSASTWRARRPGSRPATTRCSSRATRAPGAIPTATTSRRTARSARATTPRSALPVADAAARPGHQARVRPRVHRAGPARGHPGLSVTVGYYRRGTHNQRRTQNIGWSPSDYTIVNVVSPLDGSILPVYNLDPSKRGNVDRTRRQLDRLGPAPPHLQRRPARVQRARLGGAQFFGGWTVDRLIDVRCDAIESNQARYAGTAAIAANNYPQPDYHWCDQSQLDMPLLHEFKLAGSYTLPWSASRRTSRSRATTASRCSRAGTSSPTTRYAANCVGALPARRAGRAEHDAGRTTSSIWSRPGRQYYAAAEPVRHGLPQAVPLRPVSGVRRRPTSSTSSTRPT